MINDFIFLLLVQLFLAFTSCGVLIHAQGINLGGGIITRTDVEVYADLSLDLRDMRSYNNSEALLRLYNEGQNAELESGLNFRLKDISAILGNAATLTPVYLFQMYGLAGLSSNSLDDFKHYADNFIRSTIESDRTKAAEAINVLILWMYGTHLLLWGVDTCAKKSVADNADVIESVDGGGWDEFIALWIGKDQTPASTDGHGLYAWAQEIGEIFKTHGTEDTEAPVNSQLAQQVEEIFGTNNQEASVNSQLKYLYKQGSDILSSNDACSRENSESVRQLWNLAQQMVSQMFIPLFQRLIYAMNQRDDNLVALYATALIPQISQCRPSVFNRLNEILMSGNVDFDKTHEVLGVLNQAYPCFGLISDDIGSYEDEQQKRKRKKVYQALAGYRPTSNVLELSHIDLDILQLRLLSSMELFSFAKHLYTYGKNTMKAQNSENDPIEFLSLRELATSSKRRLADPVFSQFVSYFDEENYADKAIARALSGSGKWNTAEQRSEVIFITSAYQILFMSFLAELNEAVELCENPDPNWTDADMHPWDQVAAFLIGSLERPLRGGSSEEPDGQLLWSLGDRRAFQFQTLSNSGFAEANSEMRDLLFAGQGELDALDCTSLRWTAKRLEKVATIPIVQSAIRYAILNEGVSVGSNHTDLAAGETFALSILPILAAVDKESAETIKENMVIVEGVVPIHDGPQVVAEAFGAALAKWNVDCRDIGSTSQVDPCRLNPKPSESAPLPMPSLSASPSARFGVEGILVSLSLGIVNYLCWLL